MVFSFCLWKCQKRGLINNVRYANYTVIRYVSTTVVIVPYIHKLLTVEVFCLVYSDEGCSPRQKLLTFGSFGYDS